MEYKKNVLEIVSAIDKDVTTYLNKLRDNLECFYLTTDEILAYKNMIYGSEAGVIKTVAIYEDLYGEEYANALCRALTESGVETLVRPILQKVRDRMVKDDVILGKTLGQRARKEGVHISSEKTNIKIAHLLDSSKEELLGEMAKMYDDLGILEWGKHSFLSTIVKGGSFVDQRESQSEFAEYNFLMNYIDGFSLTQAEIQALSKYGVYSPTMYMCMTTGDILNQVKDINLTEYFFKNRPMLLEEKFARQLKKQKRCSMPVWEGRTPNGDELKMFEVVRAGEIAMQYCLPSQTERAVQELV